MSIVSSYPQQSSPDSKALGERGEYVTGLIHRGLESLANPAIATLAVPTSVPAVLANVVAVPLDYVGGRCLLPLEDTEVLLTATSSV